MRKTKTVPNPLTLPAGKISDFVMLQAGLRRILMATYARINRFSSRHGHTTLCNDRMAEELNCSRRTIIRHIVGLRDKGVVLAVYGYNPRPHSKFHGYTRWLLTHGPQFAEGLATARSAAGDTFSFSSLVDADIADPTSLWAFIAYQETLFPGTARQAASWLFDEVGCTPDGTDFTGAFDDGFFARLSSVFCAHLGVRSSTQSFLPKVRKLPQPPEVASATSGGFELQSLSEPSQPCAASAEASEDPVQVSGHENPLSPANPVSEGSAYKQNLSLVLAKPSRDSWDYQFSKFNASHPDKAAALMALIPLENFEASTGAEIRRVRKHLTTGGISLRMLDFIADFYPTSSRQHLMPRVLEDEERVLKLVVSAADNFLSTVWLVVADWQYGMAQDQVACECDFENAVGIRTPYGWDQALDQGQLRNGPGHELGFWRSQSAHHVYNIYRAGRAGDSSAATEHSTYIGAPLVRLTVLQNAARLPEVWRPMFSVSERLGDAVFAAIFGFTTEALKNAVRLHADVVRNTADVLFSRWGEEVIGYDSLAVVTDGQSLFTLTCPKLCMGAELPMPEFISPDSYSAGYKQKTLDEIMEKFYSA